MNVANIANNQECGTERWLKGYGVCSLCKAKALLKSSLTSDGKKLKYLILKNWGRDYRRSELMWFCIEVFNLKV